MDCICNKCVEKKEELERLNAIKKLSAEEIHVLNKDKANETKWSLYCGFALGLVGATAIFFELLWLIGFI